jgi:hypothetical protein
MDSTLTTSLTTLAINAIESNNSLYNIEKIRNFINDNICASERIHDNLMKIRPDIKNDELDIISFSISTEYKIRISEYLRTFKNYSEINLKNSIDVSILNTDLGKYCELSKWCNENCKEEWAFNKSSFSFESLTESVFFKLLTTPDSN